MTLVHFALLNGHLHLCRKFEQTQIIGNSGTLLPHFFGQCVLRKAILFEQVLVSQGNLYGIEVLALYILHEGHLHHFLIIGSPDVCGHSFQSGHLAGSPAPFSGNNLIRPIVHLPQGDGLYDTNLTYAFGKFLHCLGIKFPTGLVGVGLNVCQGHLVDTRRAAGMHLTGRYQRIESTPERVFLVCCHVLKQLIYRR